MEDINIEIIRDRLKNFFKKKDYYRYLYLAFFFIVFSFSILFIIRPVLKLAFDMKQKRDDLASAVDRLNSVIDKIVLYNLDLEKYREDFNLLDESFPEKMQVYNQIISLRSIFEKYNLFVNSISLQEIPLILPEESQDNRKKVKKIIFQYTLEGRFSDFVEALRELYDQRRINVVKNISATKELSDSFSFSTEEPKVQIQFEIESYFR